LIGSAAAGTFYLHRWVRNVVVFTPEPPKVVLVNRPVWMSDFLAETIAHSARPATATSPLDHQALKDAVAVLRHNPWIRNVRQVRRVYRDGPGDTLEIDCDYR